MAGVQGGPCHAHSLQGGPTCGAAGIIESRHALGQSASHVTVRTLAHRVRGSAILAAVLLRLRLPRLLPISYFHHEESPDLEGGHEEAQHGASRPCNHQGPNADILYPRQVIARLSPYPPTSPASFRERAAGCACSDFF